MVANGFVNPRTNFGDGLEMTLKVPLITAKRAVFINSQILILASLVVWLLLRKGQLNVQQMNFQAKLMRLPVRTFSRLAAGLTALLGALVLAGWTFDVQTLVRILPGLSAMNPTASLCFILVGASLWCSQAGEPDSGNRILSQVGKGIGMAVVLIGLLKLGSYQWNWRFQVDQLVLPGKAAADGTHLLRAMSPNTALNFVFCGLGLVGIDVFLRRGAWPAQYFVCGSLLLAWLTLIDYIFNPALLYSPASFVPMAAQTAVGFLAGGLGILAARPGRGVLAIWFSEEAGGKIMRRLLPLAVLIPSILGGLRLMNQKVSLFGADFGVSLMVLASITISAGAIWSIAASVNENARERRLSDKVLRDSERRFRSVWASSVDGMRLTDSQGIVIDVNPAFCQLTDMKAEELIGQPVSALYHEDENPRKQLQKYKERFQACMIDKDLEQRIRFRSGKVVDLEFSVSFMQLEGGKPLSLAVFKDITERKCAEAKIRELNEALEHRVIARTAELSESERRYRFMADAMPQIVWTATADGDLDYYNQRWLDYTGMTFEETRNWGWQHVLHPDDLQNCLARWRQAVETGEPYEAGYRLKRASDGAYRWQLGRAFPLKDEQGQIVQWFGTCTDIDDFKRAEDEVRQLNVGLEHRVNERTAALAQANTKLEGILNGATQVSIIAVDTEGLITMWNAGAERMLGYTAEEMVGKTTPEKLHVEAEIASHSQRLSKQFGRAIEGFDVFVECARQGEYEEQEWTYVRKDGRRLAASLAVTALRKEDGTIDGFLAIAKDITRNKEAEEDLRASEARFRTLSASAPIGIFRTDVQGRCLYANTQWLRIAGLSFMEAQGDGWGRSIYPADRDGVLKEWADCTRERREFTREFRLQTPEGIVRWVRSRAGAIMAQGEVAGYVGTTEDITERRAAEEQLRRFAGDLEQSNAELKEALANVKTLRGLLPICSGCKKIRDDRGYWNQIEFFIRDRSDASFSHGMCPECSRKYFPDFAKG
jgi:PAS domain S-box-containing protein